MVSANIKELRAHFNKLSTPKKKEFILNLRQKLSGVEKGKYKDFLNECTRAYNHEVKAHNKKVAPKKPAATTTTDGDDKRDVAAEMFAKAIATMLAAPEDGSGLGATISVKRLVGMWERQDNGKVFYCKFNDDGTFESNEVGDLLTGSYVLDPEGVLHMEPHEIMKIVNIVVSGRYLMMDREDGSFWEYKRV